MNSIAGSASDRGGKKGLVFNRIRPDKSGLHDASLVGYMMELVPIHPVGEAIM